MDQPTDERLDQIIANLLRAGVSLSAAIVLMGGICYLTRHGKEPASYHSFQGTPEQYRTVSGIVAAAAQFDCRGVIQLGLLVLIATPIARVALSMVVFAMQRDWKYVVVTTIVLAVMLYGLVVGIAE